MTTTSQMTRYQLNPNGVKNVVAFRSPQGLPVAFHAENLQVAQLSEEAWAAFQDLSPSQQGELLEARAELQEWADSEATDLSDEASASYISSINLNVTQICNLKCVYCEAGGDGSYGRPEKKLQLEKALPILTRLLHRVPNQEHFTVTFVGGEPLLYPEGILAVADYVQAEGKSRGIEVTFRVVTNGTLISDETLQILTRYRMELVVSLDGPPELQNKIRPTSGGGASAAKLEEGLRKLAAQKDNLGKITLRAIFGPHQTQVRPVYDYMKKWNFSHYELNFDVTCSDVEVSRKFTESMRRLAQDIAASGDLAELRKVRLFDHVFSRLDRKLRVKNFCDSGKSFAVMDAKGHLFKCPWEVNQISQAVGDIDSDQAMQKLQDIEMPLIEQNNCGKCWARHLCGGGCMYAHGLATGMKSRPDPVYCERTRSLISEAIMVYTLSREVANEKAY